MVYFRATERDILCLHASTLLTCVDLCHFRAYVGLVVDNDTRLAKGKAVRQENARLRTVQLWCTLGHMSLHASTLLTCVGLCHFRAYVGWGVENDIFT